MKIAVAADHGGYELKREVTDHLIARGEDVIDLGTDSLESVDSSRIRGKLRRGRGLRRS